MTDDFDDPDLVAALRNMAGAVPDVDAALPVFHRRVRVARIQRISVAVSGAAAVALLAVGAVALTGNEKGNDITPTDRSITLDTVTDPPTGVDTTTTTSVTSTLLDNGTPGITTGSGSGAAGTSGSNSTAPTVPSGSTSTTVDEPNDEPNDETDETDETSETSDDRNEGSGQSPTTTATGGRAVTKRCSSAGGSFTASHLNKNSVIDVSPAPGFSRSEQEIESDKITVVFADNAVEYHVIARWTGGSFSCSVES